MAQLALINPRKRRTASKRRAKSRRKNPVPALRTATNPRRKRRSYRRNPVGRGGFGGVIQKSLLPALTAAGGATALDVVWGMLPLPGEIKTGPMRHIAKGAGALAIGMLARNVINKNTADMMTLGMLTTVSHSAMREMVTRFAPTLALGMVTDELSAYGNDYDMGAVTYDEMGYISPTPVADGDDMGEYDDMSAVADMIY